MSSLPYVPGSATSHAAAQSSKVKAVKDRARILAEIQKVGPAGMTCWEVEAALSMKHQTASARINDLYYKNGSIRRSGQRRLTDTRNWADVWVFVPPANRPAVLALAEAEKKLRDLCNTVKKLMLAELEIEEVRQVHRFVQEMVHNRQPKSRFLGSPDLPHPDDL